MPFDQDPNHHHAHGPNMIHVIANKIDTLSAGYAEMRLDMREMASAITKLAIIDERQIQANQAQERTFKALEKLVDRLDATDVRIDALERAAPMTAQTNTWVMAGVWGFCAIVATLLLTVLARKLGLS